MTTVSPRIESQARELLGQMTPVERLRLLAGYQDFYREMLGAAGPGHRPPLYSAAAIPRLGLAGLRFVDGPRGVARGVSTCFPVAIARAATFDHALEERVGEAIGRETRAHGANVCLAPCLNLLRHPGWGRAQETYGENSGHIGEMGAAFVRGLQRHVMGCAKHFACNTIEESRFKVDVRVRPEVLDRVYLPHFKRVVDEGVGSVMSAYNAVNGEWCGQNHRLLTSILKDAWGFDGFVVSDWVFGIRDGVAAVSAGLDLEMPARLFIDDRVAKAIERGVVPQARVDDAALRLIRQQLRFRTVGDGGYDPSVIACGEHRALAREAATKAIVLLRNEAVEGRPVLPLDPRGLRRLAVIGRLAAAANTGDHGSSNVTAPYVVTPLDGLRAALQPFGVEVLHDDGSAPDRAAALAAGADAAIVVAGYDYRDEGEYMGEFPPPGFKGLLPRPPLRLIPKALARRRAAAPRRARVHGRRWRPPVTDPPPRRGGAHALRRSRQHPHHGRLGLRVSRPDGAVAPLGPRDPHAVVRGHGERPRARRHPARSREADRPSPRRHPDERRAPAPLRSRGLSRRIQRAPRAGAPRQSWSVGGLPVRVRTYLRPGRALGLTLMVPSSS